MSSMIDWLVGQMISLGAAGEDESDVLVYGLDLLFSSVLTIAALLLLGWIAGFGLSTLLLLAAFIPLQSFGGGYHCQTHLRCFLMTTCNVLAALLLSRLLPLSLLMIAALAAALPIYRIAPVEHPNAPFGEAFGRRMAKIVRVAYLSELALAVLLLLFGAGHAARPILAALSLSALSICAARALSKHT